ncbi:hypothetical protein [Dermatophilus congolensis]|uniref:hypothetical protein n=1 Tax=Dermatophilus congolensis TaxID=1863 RepID=UPI0012B57F13|nr:hypothetical protein [Dermatophilus congolensis]MBO3129474.1 hypothetical protein [Dermatophilus congolensis]MBO3131893.1 hypothetical protein [Dermatophilus congolensis]MBO3133950.1 hypothetical protein [Dermatophilus congolensis]MBO3136181.1 hypothetical protein [Dermatophilus congolensis]MBO3138425.1 hypothetical protein [Dermatophilus congolensis]
MRFSSLGEETELPVEEYPPQNDSVSEGPSLGPVERSRERKRSWIVGVALCLFIVVTVLPMVAVIFGWRSWDEIKDVSALVVPVVVSVVGSITGFYFGSQHS